MQAQGQRRIGLGKAALPLGLQLGRPTGLEGAELSAPARQALQPGLTEGGVLHLHVQAALAGGGGQVPLGRGLHTRQLQCHAALHRFLGRLPLELRLQHSLGGLQAQAVDVPTVGVPLARELQLFPWP